MRVITVDAVPLPRLIARMKEGWRYSMAPGRVSRGWAVPDEGVYRVHPDDLKMLLNSPEFERCEGEEGA